LFKKLAILVIIIMLIGIAVGCATRQILPKNNSLITGIVTSSRGGSAEEGVTVSVGNYTTQTDNEGEFSLLLPEGTYDVIAVKNGFGTSKYQDVTISPETPAKLKMIILKESGASSNPPTITLNGITVGDIIQGQRSYSVDIDSDTTLNLVNIFYGKEGYCPNIYKNENNFSENWDTLEYPNGKSYLTVVLKVIQ